MRPDGRSARSLSGLAATTTSSGAAILGTTTDPATGVVTGSRPICLYPKFARYIGHGSTTQARNYVCR
jgi:hypothetical protein